MMNGHSGPSNGASVVDTAQGGAYANHSGSSSGVASAPAVNGYTQ